MKSTANAVLGTRVAGFATLAPYAEPLQVCILTRGELPIAQATIVVPAAFCALSATSLHTLFGALVGLASLVWKPVLFNWYPAI